MGLDFPADLSTGNATIDQQHRDILDALRQMVIDSTRYQGTKELAAFMEKVTKYVQIHFQTEEEFMEKCRYPYIAQHKEQHTKFMKEWVEISLWYVGPRGGDNLFSVVRVVAKVGEWFHEHILKSDVALAQWIREMEDCTGSKSSSPEA